MPKKDGIAAIFGIEPKKGPEKERELPMGDEPDGEDGEGDGYEALESACDEFLEHLGIALPGPKKKAACEALKNFVHLAMDEDKEEEPEDEGEEEPEPEEAAPEAEG